MKNNTKNSIKNNKILSVIATLITDFPFNYQSGSFYVPFLFSFIAAPDNTHPAYSSPANEYRFVT